MQALFLSSMAWVLKVCPPINIVENEPEFDI